MNPSVVVKTQAIPKKVRGPFVFFTWEGLAWMLGAMSIFIFALASGSTYLLIFSLLLIGLTIVVIFLTHENMNGVVLHTVSQEVDLLSGQSFCTVKLSNTSSSPRYQMRIRMELEAPNTQQMAASLSELLPDEVVPMRFLLPWTEPGEVPPLLGTISVESRFPCGLVRSWKLPKRRDLATTHNLLPVPSPQKPLESVKDQNPSSDDHDTSSETHSPYRFESPSRIDWITSFRAGELLTRNSRAEFQNPPSLSGNPEVVWDTAKPGDHKRVFGETLENLRLGQSFTLSDPNKELRLSWRSGEVSRSACLVELLGLLHDHGASRQSPVPP